MRQILFFVIAISCKSADRDNAAILSADNTCPLTTAMQWNEFIANHTCINVDPWYRSDFCKSSDDEKKITNIVRRCEKFLSQNPKIEKCFHRLKNYLVRGMTLEGGSVENGDSISNYSMGFKVPNSDYIKQQPKGLFRFPKFLESNFPNLNKSIAAAKKAGWAATEISSHFYSPLAGPANKMILYKDFDRYDQWLITDSTFGLGAKIFKVAEVFSMIVVEKKSALGKKFRKPRIHFREFKIKEKTKKALLYSPEYGSTCVSCHVSGMIQFDEVTQTHGNFHPYFQPGNFGFDKERALAEKKRLARNAANMKLIKRLNKIMVSYGTLDFGPHYERDLGPEFAPKQCGSCHDGVARGKLVGVFWQLLHAKYLTSASMPPDTSYDELHKKFRAAEDKFAFMEKTRQKRRAKFDAMMKDWQKRFKKWVTAVRCE